MAVSRLNLQSKLILMLLLVCIGSIVAIGVIAYSAGKNSLTQAIFNQLTSIRASKRSQVESQFQEIRNQILNLSRDPSVVECMLGLRANFGAFTDTDIQPGWDAKLLAYYQDDFLAKLAQDTGKHPIVDAFLPRSAPARYLQYWYLANNPYPVTEKDRLLKAEDGSAYSTVHARFHPVFEKFVRDFGYDNLFLIDNKGNVVYTLTKSPVFATNILTGPYSDNNIAEMFRALIGAKDQDSAKLVDFMRLDTAFGKPVALIGAPIFDGPNQIGVIAIQLPIDEINRVVTGNMGWQREGLGKTGEVFLVGSDFLMRSRSRLLWENKPKFFANVEAAGYSKAEIDQVRQVGTALLAQYARMKAVENALAGKQGLDIETDYLGQSALVSYSPLDIQGLRWVIVATMQTGEVFAPLSDLTRLILSCGVLIVLLVTVLAAVLAHYFVSPIYQLADKVAQFKAGKTDVEVDFATHDEYQDLGVAFNEMTRRIQQQAGELNAQKRRTEELLQCLAPPAIAARLAKGEQDVFVRSASATVLLARLSGFAEATSAMSADAVMGLFNELISTFDEAAARQGVEKLGTSGYTYLAVCGLSERHLDHTRRMVEFARELPQILARLDLERSLNLTLAIAIDAGPLIGGIVGHAKFSYDVFGRAVDRARAMLFHGGDSAVLVSQSVYESVQDLYDFEGPFAAPDEGTVWILRPGPASPAREEAARLARDESAEADSLAEDAARDQGKQSAAGAAGPLESSVTGG